MLLIELPPEILGEIIRHYVNDVGVATAWKTRDVCDKFKVSITYEILAKQPESSFLGRRWDKGSQYVLRQNLGSYIRYRMQHPHGARSLVPDFVRTVVSKLMAACGKSDAATREAYTDMVINLIVGNSESVYTAITAPLGTSTFDSASKEFTGDAINSTAFDAAAFLGNLEAVRVLLPNVRVQGREYSALGHSLSLPALKGHIHILKAVLKYRIERGETLNKYMVRQAIDVAVKNRHTGCATFLLNVYTKYCQTSRMKDSYVFNAFNYALRLGLNSKNEQLMVAAFRVKFGRGLVALYLDAWDHVICSENWFSAKFLVEHGLINPNQEYRTDWVDDLYAEWETPLTVAVKTGQPDLVQMLLDPGGDPNGSPGMRHKPHWDAVQNEYWDIVVELVKRGAEEGYDDPVDESGHCVYENYNGSERKHLKIRPMIEPGPTQEELFHDAPDSCKAG
ncbi:uncharacterized protein EI97DRAFT_459873 [Westerdykella ornata]|uniref:Uncharacterized protein n=1 Tax=Westerdykella ornata TaxID=318751 RepID=A0A6A6JE82_WESOR|nr:uncharacterized protein EI97DRAFT_459873 [Westerdykella ornata]KAF2274920.1 hypothetical protein EI97DRAFT_459873 [Westerdykella ornata]